jgi:hypothetical protein
MWSFQDGVGLYLNRRLRSRLDTEKIALLERVERRTLFTHANLQPSLRDLRVLMLKNSLPPSVADRPTSCPIAKIRELRSAKK